MGDVLQFKPRRVGKGSDFIAIEQAVTLAAADAKSRVDVLRAATPLIEQCRDRFGFTLMRSGLPDDPRILIEALLALYRGLRLVGPLVGARPSQAFGVYLGQAELRWFDDGYSGTTGLAVPNRVEPQVLADFLRPRLTA